MTERLRPFIRRGLVVERRPLGPYTTYKAGGPARYLIEVEDEETLEELAAARVAEEIPVLVLGRGSNLLVSDAGFPGLVVRLGAGFSWVSVGDEVVEAGGATPLPLLARHGVEAGRRGLEFMVGIPGSVGGAVRQNAGCLGVETKDRLVDATVVDLVGGSRTVRDPIRLDLAYRHSDLEPTEVVTKARFRVTTGDREEGAAELRRITRWRKENQPGGAFNAGSVFKNPPGGPPAGELIDSLGLKGLRVGGVSVSAKHANFFVAEPGATSQQIRQLILEVKDRVFRATGTILEPEVQLVGFEE